MTMKSTRTLIVIGASLTVGNYLFQLAMAQDWQVAFDRSFFQCVALLLAAIFGADR